MSYFGRLVRGFLLKPGNKREHSQTSEHSETPASRSTNWSQSLDQLVPVVDVVWKHLPTAPSSGQRHSLQRIPACEPGGFYFHFRKKQINRGRSDGLVEVKGYNYLTSHSFLNMMGTNLVLKGQSQGQLGFEGKQAAAGCGIILIQTIWSCQTDQQSLIKPTHTQS